MSTCFDFREHPLIGRWRADEEDGRSEYEISFDGFGLKVVAHDFYDGEPYVVSDVYFDEMSIGFVTHMQSTGRIGKCYIWFDGAEVLMKFTFTEFCNLTKVT